MIGTLTITNARLVTMEGRAGPRRGMAMRELGIIERGELVIRDGVIESVRALPEEEFLNAKDAKGAEKNKDVTPASSIEMLGLSMRARTSLWDAGYRSIGQVLGATGDELLGVRALGRTGLREVSQSLRRHGFTFGAGGDSDAVVINAGGCVVMPGLVDCHTHACWAGSRIDEWEQKRAGRTYLEILAAGGGIMATVRAVRAASEAELTELLLARLDVMLRCGATTIEVKSGYGLDTQTELKMLRAIREAGATFPGTLVGTALLGHAIDPAVPGDEFVRAVIEQTLPAVSAEFPGTTVDAYCETGAWSREQCVRLFQCAVSLGHPIRVHADQFNSLGMVPAAAALGARSVDHLEASSAETLALLAPSSTIGVALPVCGLHVDGRYTNLRPLIDANGAAAIASNYNPGSAPCPSVAMAMALAVRQCGLTVAEAICAATVNAAAVLGFSDRGVLAPGMRGDAVMLRSRDEREMVYEFGAPPVEMVVVGGEAMR